MFEIRNEKKKNIIRLGIIFLTIGIIAFSICYYYYHKINKEYKSYDKEVEAYKIEPNCKIDHDGDESCSPIYHFSVLDNNYVCKSTGSSSNYNENEKTVFYKKGNPDYCITQFDYKHIPLYVIGFIASIVSLGFAIICFIRAFLAAKKVKNLLKNGTIIKGIPFVPEVTNDIRYTIPVVDFQIPDGRTFHLVGDPISSRKFGNTGETVDVLIDLNNPKTYYIDFEIRMSGEFNNPVIDYRNKADIFGENEGSQNVSDRISNFIKK